MIYIYIMSTDNLITDQKHYTFKMPSTSDHRMRAFKNKGKDSDVSIVRPF